ncbi:MAG: tetratricopeptide repeat protein [Gemmatimonadaceae bacterium]
MKILSTGKGLRTLPRLVLATVLALSAGACDTDKIVEVEDPAARRPEEINNTGSVPALVNGALRQFIGGYSGFGGDSFLSSSGVISDELYYGDTFTTRDAADKRTLQPAVLGNISDGSFGLLQQARFNARRAFATVAQFSTPATAAADGTTQAQLRTIEGYVYVTLSEGWCGSVPFSVVPDTGVVDASRITNGVPLSTAGMNDTAVTRFNQALALNSSNALAAVGKARALLNLGRFAEAAAAVQSVPTSYVFLLEHSINTPAENNPIRALIDNGRYSVSNLEGAVISTTSTRPDATAPATTAPGAEGIAFRGLRDPRVPWEFKGRCFSAVNCFFNNNYSTLDADVPLASGVEARLIEAEAALRAGNTALMLSTLNTLRANVTQIVQVLYPGQKAVQNPTGLQPLIDPGTPDTRRALFFQERALWLFNTGHRQGDLRRLVRQYGVPSNVAFPSGTHFRGGTFGNDVAYPVPFNEENNREFNRAACVTTAA